MDETAETREDKEERRRRRRKKYNKKKFRRRTNPEIVNQRQKSLREHSERLRKATSVVDTTSPKKFPHLLRNPKRELLQELEKDKIRRDNEYLKEILHRAVQSGSSLKRTSNESRRNLKIAFVSKKNAERRRIYEDNQRLLARITKARREGGGVNSMRRKRSHKERSRRKLLSLTSPIKPIEKSTTRWSSLTSTAIRSPTNALLKIAIESRPQTRRLRPLRLREN